MLFSLNPLIKSGALQLSVDGVGIERVPHTKYLGVIIDDCLTWAMHISHIEKKISKSIGVINRAKHVLNRNTLVMLYYALIYPYLSYCHLIWGKSPNVHLRKLVVLQKRVIRIITMSPFLAHTNTLFRDLEILRVDDLYIYLCSIFIYRCLRSLYPRDFTHDPCFNPFFSRSTTTRHSLYHIPYFRTTLGQRSICYQSVKLFNEVLQPLNVFEFVQSVNQMKSFMRNLLCS